MDEHKPKPNPKAKKTLPLEPATEAVQVSSALTAEAAVKPALATKIAEAKPTVVVTAEAAQEDDIDQALLDTIEAILVKLDIVQVYFVDDAINLNIDKSTFLGLVSTVINNGDAAKLKEIKIQSAINFNTEETVLLEHVGQAWDTIKPGKQNRYFSQLFALTGQPEAINDIDVTNHLKDFFKEGILVPLSPVQWDEKKDAIIASIPEGKRILVLFDQDLKLAEGRFVDDGIQGEHLILETKQRNVADKVIQTLFTHTVPNFLAELPERQKICERYPALTVKDFFVLSKSRLDKQALFTDGLKKACLNTYCEQIKEDTVSIIQEAQRRTIDKINTFDTYDFDQTVFQSSFTEGVWEPETLLRITDVIFKDEIRGLMLDQGYVNKTNGMICAAREVSGIKVDLKDEQDSHKEKFKLRHQELYESSKLLNQLRRPIDNGDIFKITSGAKSGKTFILIAQECDLMVRSKAEDKGTRGSNTATMAEIELLTHSQLLAEQKRYYESQIKKEKYGNHFFADRYKLSYFEYGTNKVGIVDFKEPLLVNLNILDLIVFNGEGKAVLNFNDPAYDLTFHNFAWQSRYDIIAAEFTQVADELDLHYAALGAIADEGQRDMIKAKLNQQFTFITQAGLSPNYRGRIFDFGIERIGRLRLPKSKNLLDRYYLHLSRFAEPHDFAS